MSTPVAIRRDGDIAIVTIDNPPVNALSHAVRGALLDALREIEADGSVRAAVLGCAGKTFVAGADIREFGNPRPPPLTRDVAAFLDGMTKPVVAALFGTALGGGLELALASHARIAAPGTRLGLPEVKLGLIPGGGGTQRLPRAIGAAEALRMIVTGEPVTAARAREIGLIDTVADGDLMEAAIEQARALAGSPPRRLRDADARLATERADLPAFEANAAALLKRLAGQDAPGAAVGAVRASLTLSFDAGMAREAGLFDTLAGAEQSAALRHLFFAERAATKPPALPAGSTPPRIQRVAIVGAGTMGRGIAIAVADAGLSALLIDSDAAALALGLAAIERITSDALARGSLRADAAAARRRNIAGADSLGRAGAADLVIEAVFEDMAVKREVFAVLDRVTRPDALLATNTSYLDVDTIAAATARPQRVAGMHFFSPANVMRLVEVVRGSDTAPETLAALVAMAKRLRKVPVIVGNAPGFVGNRMLRRRNEAAERLLLEGALPHEIDAAMLAFGFPMGPLAAGDLAGLDIGWRMRRANGLRAEIADALCEMGRFGQKTGRGFYRYEAGSRTPLRDPQVESVIAEAAHRLGFARRAIAPDEMVQRLLLPIVNEGARILAEGIAGRPGDIDVIWVNGYAWPAWRGGPMWYADRMGLALVRDRLAAMQAEGGEATLAPAPLLAALAAEGRGFSPLDTAAD